MTINYNPCRNSCDINLFICVDNDTVKTDTEHLFIMSTLGMGGHTIFAISAVRHHPSFPLILRKSIRAVFTKFDMLENFQFSKLLAAILDFSGQ